ncbi:MAG: ABC transporter substrate-binding protein, partial [Bacillus sp. (in: firmicutes)]
MKKRSFKLLLISLLAISMFLVGCNSKTNEEAGGKKDPAAGSGSKKDTLVYGRGGDSTSLDPITTTEG